MNPIRNLMAGIEPWTTELGSEKTFPDYHIYSFEWIDRLSHFEDAEEELTPWTLKNSFLNHFRHRFADAGWNGDGKMQILWLPPFSGIDAPTSGFYILHVKQKEDGVSWIASRYRIVGLDSP